MENKRPKIRLAENLSQLMKQKRTTISSVSRQAGINKSTVHNYLNGVMPSGIIGLQNLADFFGVTTDQLVYGDKLGSVSVQISGDIEGQFLVKVEKIK